MATITSNQVTVNVVSSTSTIGSYCTTGMYITIYGSSTTPGSGKSYQYNYEWGPPSGYNYSPTPNFCIYYEGKDAPTGCYCNFGTNNQHVSDTVFYQNFYNPSEWWAMITLPNNYQFSIAWSE